MKIACENAESLIPSYVDAELSEEQAAPLRRHLLACHSCREAAQGEQVLKRWFVPEAVAPPSGFASRVARRAFAGDIGVLPDEGIDAPPAVRANGTEGAVLSFVIQVTAVAAAVLLVLALSIRGDRLPDDSELSAETYPQVLEELDALNDAEEAKEEANGARGE